MRRLTLLATSLALVVPLVGASPASADTIAAKDLLAKLSAVGEKGSASYDRDKFSYPIDADGDKCATRAEVLIQELWFPPNRGGLPYAASRSGAAVFS